MKTKQEPCKKCEGPGCCQAKRGTFKRLLVAADGSEQSEYAVETAAGLARQLHADVVLVNVFNAHYIPYSEISFVEPNIRVARIEAANALLTRARMKMPNPAQVQLVVRDGDPATEILNAALVYDANMIVMGTHARGRTANAVLGSVARAVTQKAACPVLTVAHGSLDNEAMLATSAKDDVAAMG